MNGPKSELSELIALTKMHLFQEYEKGSWIMADSASYESLKTFAMGNAAQKGSRESNKTEPRASAQPPAETTRPAKAIPPKAPVQKSAPAKEQATLKKSPPEETKAALPPQKPALDLQPLPSPNREDFKEMRKLISRLFPNQHILDGPLEHAGNCQAAKAEALLILSEDDAEIAFHQNLARAIRISLGLPARLCSLEKDLENELRIVTPKLLIGTENTLNKIASSHKDLPLISLPPMDAIRQNPMLKAELWKRILVKITQRTLSK